MPLWKSAAVLVFAYLHLIPFVCAVGCNQCLGYDKAVITSICKTACADPDIGFTVQKQTAKCKANCDKFVNAQSCCNTVSCSPDPQTCTHPLRLSSRDVEAMSAAFAELENVKRDASLIDYSRLISHDSPYDLIGSTEDLRLLNSRALGHWQLEESGSGDIQRRGPGDVCCKVAKTMVGGAQGLLPMTQSKDDLYAGIITIVIGLAAAEVCGYYFAMICNPYVFPQVSISWMFSLTLKTDSHSWDEA